MSTKNSASVTNAKPTARANIGREPVRRYPLYAW
jgi:hypothetical protein